MEMSFVLEMDREILKGSHYISPGGYSLRFYGRSGVTKEIDFDFLDYEGSIVGGNCLECTVRNLDTDSFPSSVELVELLGSHDYEWAEFFVYTGEAEEPEINPIKVRDICISTEEKDYALKDYVFPEFMSNLSPSQTSIISRIMDDLIKFCKGKRILVDGSGARFYECGGDIYLCSSAGFGYRYSVNSGAVTLLGVKNIQGGLATAKALMLKAVKELQQLPFPVRSITFPYGEVKGGYYRHSVEELGSYDIVLKDSLDNCG